MVLASEIQQKQRNYTGLTAAELVTVLAEKEAELAHHNQIIQRHKNTIRRHTNSIKNRDHYIRLLEERLRLSKVQRFGANSEKLAFQIDLFDEAELEQAIVDIDGQLPDELLPQPTTTNKKKRQRGFSNRLPRVRVELALSDEEKAGATRTFFVKVKEELQYIPAQLNVLEYWQEKAVFSYAGDDHIIAAQRPIHPLGKCFASTALLANIMVSKYADGLPLYRQESILKRYGHAVSRTNMANWMIRLEAVFKPLMTLLRESQNAGDYVQMDETRIQVLKENSKTAQSDKWMWLTRGGPPDQPSVLFEYDPSRSGEVPQRLLEDFQGTLQVDGYSGYNGVCEQQKTPWTMH